MYLKSIVVTLSAFLVLAHVGEARHISRSSYRTNHQKDSYSDEAFHSVEGYHRETQKKGSHNQSHIFTTTEAPNKLVLIKFKKVLPISLIELVTGNESNAQLVPVYLTSEIPPNVQFIPTPNGISLHKDVQAIAIPNELFEYLEKNLMAKFETAETLHKVNFELNSNKGNTIQSVESTYNDMLLSVNDSDPHQELEEMVVPKEKNSQEKAFASSTSTRLAPDDKTNGASLGLKGGHHISVKTKPKTLLKFLQI